MIKWTRFRPSALDITELALIQRLPSWWACGSSPPRRRRGNPAEGGEAGGQQHRARLAPAAVAGLVTVFPPGQSDKPVCKVLFPGQVRDRASACWQAWDNTSPFHTSAGAGVSGPAPWSQEATVPWRLWSVYPEETWRKVWANSALDRGAGKGRQIHPGVVWPWASRRVSISPVVK